VRVKFFESYYGVGGSMKGSGSEELLLIICQGEFEFVPFVV